MALFFTLFLVFAFICVMVIKSSMNYEFGSDRKRTTTRMSVVAATLVVVIAHYIMAIGLMEFIWTGPTKDDPAATLVIHFAAATTGTLIWGFIVPKVVFSFVGTKPLGADEPDQTQQYIEQSTPSHEHERPIQPETARQQTQTHEAQLYPWEEEPPKKRKKPILIGAGALALLSVSAIAVLTLLLTGGSPSQATLGSCDAWLQQQLIGSPQAAANAENANTVVTYVQSQRPDLCPPSAWNPLVTNVSRDHEGNIDISFSTTTGNTGGTAVTMPADGNPGWAYSADQNTWGPRQRTPDQTRPTYTPHPAPNYTQPNAATPDPDDYIELGDSDLFFGQALAESDRGKELFDQADYHGALQAFQSAKIHHGKPSSVLENRIGTTFQSLGDHQQAIDHFTKAIEIEEQPLDRVNRALSYIETGQCPLAIHDAQQALDMEPESADGFHTDAEAHFMLSTCHLTSGDNAQAIEHAEAALTLMAANKYSAEVLATAHVSAGDIYYSEGSYAKAIEHYSQAIALGDTAEARASRAWAYIETKDCASALADGHKALAMPAVSRSGYHSGAHAHDALAYCYADESQWEKALQHEESALRLMYENHYEAEIITVAEENVQFLRTQAAQ